MKRALVITVALVAMLLLASITRMGVAKSAAINHLDVTGDCPGNCNVNFGDGSSTDVGAGAFNVSHDYAYTPGGVISYTVTVTNKDNGEVLSSFQFQIDDSPVGGGSQPSSGSSSANAGYQSWQCNFATSFTQTGNHLDISGKWMGEGHPHIAVNAGNGVTFEMLVDYNGNFSGGTDYEVTQPGVYLVTTWIYGTNQNCGGTSVTIGDSASTVSQPARSEVQSTSNTCGYEAHQPGDIISQHPRHCNWFAFTREGSLWWGQPNGYEEQVLIGGEAVSSSDVVIEPNGAIRYIGSDGREYLTDRVGSGPSITG